MLVYAVAGLDPTLRMIFFAIALVLFAVAGTGYSWGKVHLIGLGLAFFTFPFFWDALAAS